MHSGGYDLLGSAGGRGLTSPKGHKSQIRQILPSYPANFEPFYTKGLQGLLDLQPFNLFMVPCDIAGQKRPSTSEPPLRWWGNVLGTRHKTSAGDLNLVRKRTKNSRHFVNYPSASEHCPWSPAPLDQN
jgi:hypothetical protein